MQKNAFCYTFKDNTGTFKAAIILALSQDKDETMTSSAQEAKIHLIVMNLYTFVYNLNRIIFRIIKI